MKNIAIFASGTGSNAEKIINHFRESSLVRIALIISNRKEAKVLDLGKRSGIPTMVLDRSYFYETEDLLNYLKKYAIEFIVLAGFLWLIPAYLVTAFHRRMINIHPALLPKYGGKGMYGMHIHKAVRSNNDKISGITLHYVNEQYDEGAIILQVACVLDEVMTAEEIGKRVLKLEHYYYPRLLEILLRD